MKISLNSLKQEFFLCEKFIENNRINIHFHMTGYSRYSLDQYWELHGRGGLVAK
jgi:hypothetical protein